MQRDLEQVSTAFSLLDGHLMTLHFDPLDPASVEAALAQVDQTIDEKIAPYHNNQIIKNLASQMKQKYQNQILDKVNGIRLESKGLDMNQGTAHVALSQIEDIVMDLRSANYQTFDRHIKKLSRLLHSDALKDFTDGLLEGADVDKFIEVAQATHSGMTGSAMLKWPENHQDELGLVITLIDRFASDWNNAVNFSFTFYTSGSNITASLRNMIGQMIVPFTRDYLNFVKKENGSTMSENKEAGTTTYNQQFHINNSSIGAVQTGNHAVANVALQNNSQQITELLKALDVVATELAKVDSIPGHNKDEVLELVEDGKVELAKQKPNVTKLTSYMGMIGAALSGAANMKPAYETFKGAAALVGIQLP